MVAAMGDRGRTEPRRKPSPATALAIVALFVALSGTAVAVQGQIGSSDIQNNGVKSKDLAPGAVQPEDTSLTKYKTMKALRDLENGQDDRIGPTIKVDIEEGDLLLLTAMVEGRMVSGAEDCFVFLDYNSGFRPLVGWSESESGGDFIQKFPHAELDNGLSDPVEARTFTIPIFRADGFGEDGEFEATLQAESGRDTACEFRKRAMWLTVLR